VEGPQAGAAAGGERSRLTSAEAAAADGGFVSRFREGRVWFVLPILEYLSPIKEF